ncbi:MAG: DEAD/DEAH box helicase [Anaerolineaceae bacterium]|jgi:ATP-dependent RNA helicase DeaD|nr:DEAD/DEAH box helicase [Anaerolineaceae bacterium]
MNLFETLNLKPELNQAVQELEFVNPTEIQQQAIPVLMSGKDMLGQAQTGTGKTAAFALPMLQLIDPQLKAVQGFVLAPTRELALQVSKAIETFAKFTSIKILAVYGGAPYGKQLHQLSAGVQIVVGTPGRVMDLIQKKNALDLSQVRFWVLDEADEMLKMGFIDEVEAILAYAPFDCQKALFSATLPHEIRKMANRYLNKPEEIIIAGKTLTVENTEQRVYMVHEKDKFAALLRLLEFEPVTNALIFTRTKIRAAELSDQLMAAHYSAEALHGDLAQSAREIALDRFRRGLTRVLVATDVAARGLDILGVSHVFNFDIPFDAEDYIHRIGRTGRAGAKGVAISLITGNEMFRIRRFEKVTQQAMLIEKLPSEKDILAKRQLEFENLVVERLNSSKEPREIELVNKLVAEGHDPLLVAASALKLVKEQMKYVFIMPVGTVEVGQRAGRSSRGSKGRQGESRRFEHGGRSKGSRNRSHEAGMVRLSFGLGKAEQIRPTMVVGAIANEAKIPGKAVGAITIQQHETFVDVSEQYADQVIKKLKKLEFFGKPARLKRQG